VLTGTALTELSHVVVFPASHYVVAPEKMSEALKKLEEELDLRVKYFKSEDKLIEAQRIKERTNFDIEMMRETGFCSGIENYSGPLSGRPPGSMPFTLIDYFPDEFLIIVDESHITIPQIGGMYAGDRSRKTTLVDYGFRLPSALDNRPLNFTEFENKIDRMLFVSATPSEYEAKHELLRAEQIIRPTGLVDPEISVRPTAGQIDDLISEVKKETEKKNKVLVTTLTKKMAEDLTDYMREAGIRVRYLHSDIDTLERSEIIRDMRLDVFDVLVGINLLREGLDIPEITLVAILDADKEGFLRSETSLIQTIGRAARNADGHVIMYADTITGSMNRAITETERRRAIQMKYNEEHGIIPQTIKKKVRDLISISKKVEEDSSKIIKDAESMYYHAGGSAMGFMDEFFNSLLEDSKEDIGTIIFYNKSEKTYTSKPIKGMKISHKSSKGEAEGYYHREYEGYRGAPQPVYSYSPTIELIAYKDGTYEWKSNDNWKLDNEDELKSYISPSPKKED